MHYPATQISPVVAKIMTDKRNAKRVQSVFSGSVHVNGEFTAHCVIKDVSSSGMKLQFQRALDLPIEFEVKTPSIVEAVKVRVAWLSGNNCGVEFVEMDELSEADSE